jgi:aminopeptidase
VPYTPPQEILERYASVLVDYALGGGEGVKPGEVVRVTAPESARPLYLELCRAVWRAGANVIGGYYPDDEQGMGGSKAFFELASEEQLDHFPSHYLRGLVDEMDHQVSVLAEADPHALETIDPAAIMRRGVALRQLMDWRGEKENEGRFSWTLGLYGTEAMAAEAKMGIEEYWEQIVHACFLDEEDPIARWRQVGTTIERNRELLDGLEIERLHVEGEDADLWRNIPSFELFTSPDWRGTEGWIRFDQPLYRYGNLVTGISLRFEDGRVVEAAAEQNEAVLKEMIATEGADRVGEFSLTDKRLSRITRFMAHTLYDENVGGPFGNTHIALGRSYQDAYAGDPSGVESEQWERLGFNNSSVHTDIVSTADRVVTAQLRGGGERVIYRDGEFQLD